MDKEIKVELCGRTLFNRGMLPGDSFTRWSVVEFRDHKQAMKFANPLNLKHVPMTPLADGTPSVTYYTIKDIPPERCRLYISSVPGFDVIEVLESKSVDTVAEGITLIRNQLGALTPPVIIIGYWENTAVTYMNPSLPATDYRIPLLFVSSNFSKRTYAKNAYLSSGDFRFCFKLYILCDELEEIQGEHEAIAKYKADKAFHKYGLPVLVDDAGLELHALRGFPGPYWKWFSETMGHGPVLELVAAAKNDDATANCHLTIKYAPDHYIHASGSVMGTIVRPRIGKEYVGSGRGIDPLLEVVTEESGKQTLAELSIQRNFKYSHRGRAYRNLVDLINDEDTRLTMQDWLFNHHTFYNLPSLDKELAPFKVI